MNFYVADIAVRDAINEPWLDHFPTRHPDRRGTRRFVPTAGRFVTCDFPGVRR